MMTDDRLQNEIDANLEFFETQLPELLRTQEGKYALLKNREVVAVFDTIRDAQVAGIQMFPNDVFSVQRIIKEPIDLGFFSHAVSVG
jgi:hypothetical protein